jgi:probable phosphoglycerate mutase
MRILLVRHGQSEWNAQGRWQGQADPPLTDLGRQQARSAAQRLARLDVVVASDLQRAAETAAIMAAHWGADVDRHEVRLRERHAGPWQGLTHADIEREWPGWIDSPRRPPGYEPDDHVAERALGALWDLAREYRDATVLAVSHSGTIRSVIDRVNGRGVRPANLGGVWLSVSPDRIDVFDDWNASESHTITRIE